MCDAILIWRVSDLGSTVQCSTPSERANTIPIHFSFFFVSCGKARIHDFLLASEASLLTRLPFGQKSNAAKCHDRLTFSLQAFKFHLETFLFCQTRSGEVSSRGAFNGLCCKVYHSSRGKALKTLSCVLLLLKCWE